MHQGHIVFVLLGIWMSSSHRDAGSGARNACVNARTGPSGGVEGLVKSFTDMMTQTRSAPEPDAHLEQQMVINR
jgi:hypothetical protein